MLDAAARLAANKANAVAFYDLMYNRCRQREAVERYVGDSHLRHDPGVGDGKQAFVDSFAAAARGYPAPR